MPNPDQKIALVLAGGVGRGAYHGGVYEGLLRTALPGWIAGSSVGAVNAALIAGNHPDKRIDALRAFWMVLPRRGRPRRRKHGL